MTKIHCVEMQKEGFDKIPYKELRNMVGWIEPPEPHITGGKGGTWDVTLANEDGFECKDQATAMILSNIEEVKALLMEKR